MTAILQIDKNLLNVYRVPKVKIRHNGRIWLAMLPAFFKDLEKTYYDVYLKVNNDLLYVGRRKIYYCTDRNLAFSLPKVFEKLWAKIVENNHHVEAILVKTDEGQEKGVHNDK